jgi:hypothetical protein
MLTDIDIFNPGQESILTEEPRINREWTRINANRVGAEVVYSALASLAEEDF